MTDVQQKVFAIQKRMSQHSSRFGALERKVDRTATEQVEFETLDGAGEPLHLELRSALDAVKAEAEASIVKGTATDAEGRELLEKRDAVSRRRVRVGGVGRSFGYWRRIGIFAGDGLSGRFHAGCRSSTAGAPFGWRVVT